MPPGTGRSAARSSASSRSSVGIAARAVRGLVPGHRGARAEPRAGQLSPAGLPRLLPAVRRLRRGELNRERRERRAQREAARARAAARPRPVGHRVAGLAALRDRERGDRARARARERLSRPSRHRRARAARRAPRLAPERIAVGNGAAELLQSAVLVCSDAGRAADAVALLPALPAARRARGRAAGAVERGRRDCDAVTDRTRAVVICNPNDPTGDLHALRRARRAAVGAARGRPRAARRGARSSSRTSRTWTPACASWRRSRGCWWCARSRRSTGCPGCGRATRWAPTPACWRRWRPCWA